MIHNTKFGSETEISSQSEIFDCTIGDNCDIKSFVSIGEYETESNQGRVIIGNGVSIGPNVVIAKGVTIGSGATINPFNVIVSDVADNEVL